MNLPTIVRNYWRALRRGILSLSRLSQIVTYLFLNNLAKKDIMVMDMHED